MSSIRPVPSGPSQGDLSGETVPQHFLRVLRGRPVVPLKVERSRVDAVSLAGWIRAILEQMAEVSSTLRTNHFGATHAKAVIRPELDVVLIDHVVKARPSRSGLKLGVGVKERSVTDHATVHPVALMVPVLPAEGPFGALLLRNVVLLLTQLAAELLVGRPRFFDVGHVAFTRGFDLQSDRRTIRAGRPPIHGGLPK